MKRVTTYSSIITLLVICFVVFFIISDNFDVSFGFFICGIIIIIGGIYFSQKFLKTEKVIFEIESLPILEVNEATDGVPFAGEGKIEPENGKIVNSFYKNLPCVYYHSIKEKLVRVGKYSYWEVIENVVDYVPFYIKDKTGKLKVDLRNLDDDFSQYEIPLRDKKIPNPKNSEIDCIKAWREIRRYGVFSKDYRFTEYILPPYIKVFACGMVSKKGQELVLHESEKIPLIISRKNRSQYVEEFYRGTNLVYLSHLFAVIGFNISVLALAYFLNFFYSPTIYLVLLIGNLIILTNAIVSLYNRIITLKNRALNAFSNIEVELKRRADLIANIVEVVKGYTKEESEVQKIVAESRENILFLKEATSEKEKPIIKSLVAVIENYPQLKAIEQFQSLMKILVDTEERIAYSREFYNRTVRKYNTLIKQFPFIIISTLFSFPEMQFITIVKEEKIKPEVSF